MKCRKCDTPFSITHRALGAEHVTFSIEFEGEMLLASTLGRCIEEVAKLLMLEARHLGVKRPAVSVTSLVLEEHKAAVGLFLSAETAKPKKAMGKP